MVLEGETMITIFNRKELTVTYDLTEVSRIRDILLADRIDYSVKASYPRPVRAIGMDRLRMGSFGAARQQEHFTVYVRKTDWDRAMYLLNKTN